MAKVTGIGGIFFKSRDPAASRDWYKQHLGLPTDQYGWSWVWRERERPDDEGCTIWSPFKDDTDYFSPSEAPFMVNFRVDDLDGLLKSLKTARIDQIGEIDDQPYGRFAWIMDPDGVKIELWQPIGSPQDAGIE
jgi:catechol 2,3-dioxygenase-like lactoylglutathione lyase family enzyme